MLFDSHHRGLVDDDALSADVDQSVRRAKIDTDVK